MTVFDFAPSQTANPPWQQQMTLDGQTYRVTTTWNVFGQRWYLNVFQLNGTLVAAVPLIGSPIGINLQSLAWSLRGVVTATAAVPHGFKPGAVVSLTISGVVPTAYNGLIQAAIIGPTTFTYPLSADPGTATTFGSASQLVNLVGGYFTTSTLIYRAPTNQIEVNP